MRTGIIFYVKSSSKDLDLEEIKSKLKRLFPDVDDLEIALSPDGEDDILHAWWRLTVKGIKRVFLKFVELGEKMELKSYGINMKLIG